MQDEADAVVVFGGKAAAGKVFRRAADKKEIEALIKIYLNNGGLQFQVNSLSSALLRNAADNPEKYSDLVVRIGGYSIFFNSLSSASKEEFIERVSKEE